MNNILIQFDGMVKRMMLLTLGVLMSIGCLDLRAQASDPATSELDLVRLSSWPGYDREMLTQFVGSDDYIYLAYLGAIEIVDITNPQKPTRVAGISWDDRIYFLAYSDSILFVASERKLVGLDCSDPKNPIQIVEWEGFYQYLQIQDQALFAFDREGNRILKWDISDPQNPILEATYRNPGAEIRDMRISGNLAYLLRQGGLEMLNISNPSNGVSVGTFTSRDGRSVIASNSKAAYWPSGGLNSIAIFDVRDASHPTRAKYFNAGADFQVSRVLVKDDFLIVFGDGDRVAIFDISDPFNPQRMESNTPELIGSFRPALSQSGNLLFVDNVQDRQNWNYGLGIFSLTENGQLQKEGTFGIEGTAVNVLASSDLLFVADGSEGIKILDVKNPASPVTLGSIPGFGYAEKIERIGNFLFLLQAGSLQVLDISDPTAPRILDHPLMNEKIEHMAANDSVLLLGQKDRLRLLGISKGSEFIEIKDVTTNGLIHVLDWHDSTLTVVTRKEIQVFDASTPSDLILLASSLPDNELTTPYFQTLIDYLSVSENYVFAQPFGGFGRTFVWSAPITADISDVTHPIEIQFEPLPRTYNGLISALAYSGRIYLTYGYSSDQVGTDRRFLVIYGLDSTGKSKLIGALNTGGRISVQDDCIFLADGKQVQVVEMRETITPSHVQSYSVPEDQYIREVEEGFVFSALNTVRQTEYYLQIDKLHNDDASTTDPIRIPSEGWSRGFKHHGGKIYFIDSLGLHVWSIKDWPQLTHVADFPTEFPESLRVEDDSVFVKTGHDTLIQLHLSDSGLFEIISEIPLNVRDLDGNLLGGIYGQKRFWIDRRNNLVSFDIRDPKNPKQIEAYTFPSPHRGHIDWMEIQDHVLVLLREDTIYTYDISINDQPTLLDAFHIAHWGSDGYSSGGIDSPIVLKDHYLYVAAEGGGLHVIDFRDPSNLRRAGGNMAVLPYAVFADSSYVYVLDHGKIVTMEPFQSVTQLRLDWQSEDQLQLHLSGRPESTMEIHRSPDLLNWNAWQRKQLNAIGEENMLVPIDASKKHYFFRALQE